ncbi:MAG: zinc ribbon domain-containing protein [Actinomycetota bacterium]|nr:zinc ribbon domain-containing protein [Actinomycetota bacterium]
MPDCPACNTPLAGDERFCLQCGARLVPNPTPRQSWTIPVAIIAVIALLAVGGVVFALDQVESDAEREATEPAVVVNPPQRPGSEEEPTDLAAWPDGTAAYTVVLAETPDATTARAQAAAALSGGIPAGVLESDAYPTLEPGMWVLFAGRFDTRAEAAEEAARYVAAGFPDAEAAFVSDRRESGG